MYHRAINMVCELGSLGHGAVYIVQYSANYQAVLRSKSICHCFIGEISGMW